MLQHGGRWDALLIYLVCLTLLGSRTAQAETYYVAPNGAASGDGSIARPWPSVDYALSRTRGGNEIVVRPGIYVGGVHIPAAAAGTALRPTIVRSELKWKARIIGAMENGIYTADHADWIIIDGFEVSGAVADGVKLSGTDSVVRNCWIHNNSEMGCGAHGRQRNTFENNLIEYNGQNVHLHHGIYADGDGLIVRNNIVRHNAAYGLHLYPALRHAVVCGNLVYGHPFNSGILIECPAGGGQNRIVNNTSVGNRNALDIRNGKGEVVQNNILVALHEDPIKIDARTVDLQIDHNLCDPRSSHEGLAGITGAPRFVDADHECYWLSESSPAIGRGARQYAPATDFWGLPMGTDRAPDLGCFAYYLALTLPRARATWYYRFPYRFHMQTGQDMIDLWDATLVGGRQ